MAEGPLKPAGDGVDVAVRLSPQAGADRLCGLARSASGGLVVKVAVAAPPHDGRANAALLRLLARAWRVPARDLAIVAEAKSRNKTVRVAGDSLALMRHLAAAIAVLPGV